ncbi:sugar phosphate nucleotidyltransferase [Acidimicrobiia bacterium]|nr:sugar phosphate nucleotidyltransferase [Acidimicrobiia bacterium]
MIKQVVLLAGGKGTRMREMTETVPKPMVKIGGIPVLEHLMNIFNSFGSFEFIISSGYKSNVIEKYFKNKKNIKVINTGEETLTGGRVFRLSDYLNDEFIVTYGDGLANVNIDKLINYHEKHDNPATITVANPVSRFGLVEFDDNNLVNKFIEKPKLANININIGFFVFNRSVLSYLDKDCTLETEPLINLSNDSKLNAYKHTGYFEPMDTYREYLQLNKYWETGNPPWMKF